MPAEIFAALIVGCFTLAAALVGRKARCSPGPPPDGRSETNAEEP